MSYVRIKSSLFPDPGSCQSTRWRLWLHNSTAAWKCFQEQIQVSSTW